MIYIIYLYLIIVLYQIIELASFHFIDDLSSLCKNIIFKYIKTINFWDNNRFFKNKFGSSSILQNQNINGIYGFSVEI